MVVLLPGETVAPGKLREFAASKLPTFAVPRFVALVDELPKNSLGKVVKHSVRNMAEVKNAWDARKPGTDPRKARR